eukprot:1311214-Prymnesium_polylepis.2
MAAVLRKAGMDPDKIVAELDSGEQIKALTLASGLKDPVSCRAVVSMARIRVYEKARDDYAKRFNDAGLPEGCVVDMLRGRGVAADGSQIESLQTLLENSVVVRVEGEGDNVREVESGGEVVTLEQVRSNNKCNAKAIGAPQPDCKPAPSPECRSGYRDPAETSPFPLRSAPLHNIVKL